MKTYEAKYQRSFSRNSILSTHFVVEVVLLALVQQEERWHMLLCWAYSGQRSRPGPDPASNKAAAAAALCEAGVRDAWPARRSRTQRQGRAVVWTPLHTGQTLGGKVSVRCL